MRKRAFTIGFFLTLLGVAASAQVNTPPRTEQAETGFAIIDGHAHVPYRIRLLPVSSFPQLPAQVAQKLDAMSCMIPQTYAAHEPENVISGSFEKQGSSDWAVLCSVHGVTTLYVFFQSDFTHPVALRHQPDTLWLGKEWGVDYGSAWGIAVRTANLMRRSDQVDHDGIEDDYLDQSSVVHYFKEGQWATLDSNP